MYLSFYSFRKEPFRITPDPEFLYLSPSHKEALGAILYGVMQRKGFIAIIGEVGVGKTTILRSYIEEADKKHLRIVYVFDANVSFIGLLRTIHRELGLAGGKDDQDEPFDLVSQLQQFLITEYQKGSNLVVIIDEAQNMPIETLESLRMLSNLETSTDKLIQIVLIGPPELEERLNLKELRQLKQRIAVKASISPLTSEESAAYIQHRLTKAGASGTNDMPIFTKGALKKVIRQSHGIPRTINILCDNALITGFGYQKRKIGARIIREVIADFQQSGSPSRVRWRLAFLVILLLAAVTLWVWTFPYNGPVLSRFKVRAPFQSPPNQTSSPAKESPSPATPAHPAQQSLTKSKPSLSANAKRESPSRTAGVGEIFPQIRVVKKGDTLSDLVRGVYGSSNRELMEQVKLNNPQISDINWIMVGEEVVFPKPKGTRAEVNPSPGNERRLLAENGR